MASVHPFRRLRWGPPRRLPTPHFLRARKLRLAWLRRYFGFILLAAVIGGGAIVLKLWRGEGSIREFGLTGIAVIDGDTLHVGGERIRLIGIDAPELSQPCRDADGREWACGREAKARLTALVSVGEFTCATRGLDIYGRTLAVCSAGDVDVGEALVREGLAVDTGGYWLAELAARFARRGLWQGEFVRPQDWRKSHPRAS